MKRNEIPCAGRKGREGRAGEEEGRLLFPGLTGLLGGPSWICLNGPSNMFDRVTDFSFSYNSFCMDMVLPLFSILVAMHIHVRTHL
jgi:hypothetical protein